jgi:hypothetical protein
MNNQKALVIVALIAVLGFVAIETVDLILTMAEAQGCFPGTPAINASKGRCIH